MAKKEEENVWEWKPANDEEEIGGNLNIWNPPANGHIGDELEGKIVDINEGTYGIQADIEEDAGDIWTTPAHRVLQSAIEKLKVGDMVRITYTGVYRTPAGQNTNTYKVARKK